MSAGPLLLYASRSLLSLSRCRPASHRSCDVEQGEASICRLAAMPGWDLLLPSHDATGKGLSPADVKAFCAAVQGPDAAKAA